MNLTLLSEAWINAKAKELEAIKERRTIEDSIIYRLEIPEEESGVKSFEIDSGLLKVTSKLDKKVDSVTLQNIAMQNNLGEYLAILFRWKPEINASEWEKAPESVKKLLSESITTKPARPSFSISFKE